MKEDRIPCINPRCRRTAPAEKYAPDTEIICGKCFRALPKPLQRRYRSFHRREKRVLRAIERRTARGTITPEAIDRVHDAFARNGHAIWLDMRRAVFMPDRPAGIDGFLEEVGLV